MKFVLLAFFLARHHYQIKYFSIILLQSFPIIFVCAEIVYYQLVQIVDLWRKGYLC